MSENRNSLVCIRGVRGYEKDGVSYLHIDDVARGLGFTTVATSGNECVRWDRVEQYMSDLSFPTSWENENPHDYYIPENIFYRLCMKAYQRKNRRLASTSESPQVVIPEWFWNDK